MYDDNQGAPGGNPTMGVGMNLNVGFVREAITQVISGLTGQALLNLSNAIGTKVASYNNDLVALQMAVNIEMLAAGVNKEFKFLNEAEVKQGFALYSSPL